MGTPYVALEVEIPSDVQHIEGVVQRLTVECHVLHLSRRQCSLNVPVALSEALSNAILRGNRGDREKVVRLRTVVSDTAVIFEIRDEGPGFDLNAKTRDPTDSANVEREDGRGLFLMRQLMDRVEQFRNDGNVVRLTLASTASDMTRDLEREIENAARELAERYEEINLLYTISEILGHTVSLSEAAAATILREVSETVGARRASILVCEPGGRRCTPSRRWASTRRNSQLSRWTIPSAFRHVSSARNIRRSSIRRIPRCRYLSTWGDVGGSDHVDVSRWSRRTAWCRQFVGSAVGAAIQRRRRQARCRHRDTGGERHPECTARARIHRAAAVIAGDATGARPADEASAEYRWSCHRKRRWQRGWCRPKAWGEIFIICFG